MKLNMEEGSEMTNEEAKKIIESLKARQIAGEHLPCPRCGYDNMNELGATRNALSRHADVYICDACGKAEALIEFCYGKSKSLPFVLWDYAMEVAIK